jgi:hypothetical protein
LQGGHGISHAASFIHSAAQINFTDGVLGASLHALNMPEVLGVVVALVLGGMVKGIVSIGVPLVAMPILSQFLPIKQAVLFLSMPIIPGNIPQALEGGEMLPTVRRIAAPLIGTVLGNIVSVTVLISLAPHHAQAAAGYLLMLAALLLLAAPKLTLSPRLAKGAGLVFGFGAAMMESIASVPGPLLAMVAESNGELGQYSARMRRRRQSVNPSSIRDLGLDQFCQLKKRLLPAQVAHLHRNDLGYALLDDVDFGAAGHLPQ